MLTVGTEVFIKKVFKDENRPTRLPSGREILTSYGISCRKAFITEHIGRGYYSVSNDKDGWNTIGVVHEDEVVNMETYKPKFKVGDMVRICDISDSDKKRYIVGWVDEMDACIGQTARVDEICNYPDTYHLEDVWWDWHASNLEPASEFIGF